MSLDGGDCFDGMAKLKLALMCSICSARVPLHLGETWCYLELRNRIPRTRLWCPDGCTVSSVLETPVSYWTGDVVTLLGSTQYLVDFHERIRIGSKTFTIQAFNLIHNSLFLTSKSSMM